MSVRISNHHICMADNDTQAARSDSYMHTITTRTFSPRASWARAPSRTATSKLDGYCRHLSFLKSGAGGRKALILVRRLPRSKQRMVLRRASRPRNSDTFYRLSPRFASDMREGPYTGNVLLQMIDRWVPSLGGVRVDSSVPRNGSLLHTK